MYSNVQIQSFKTRDDSIETLENCENVGEERIKHCEKRRMVPLMTLMYFLTIIELNSI